MHFVLLNYHMGNNFLNFLDNKIQIFLLEKMHVILLKLVSLLLKLLVHEKFIHWTLENKGKLVK